ncbi:MAG: glutamate--tRNA ligase [Oscillospiraceae bacterium]|nr:glutamate--tRNA ligase [Oscillospiraceae bacterium]
MHLGNLRTALYSWLYTKKNNGSFVLRIEDTDRSRYVDGAVEVIYETLKECGIKWDEGPDIGGDYAPYIQSERKNAYLEYALELIKKDCAYYCCCPADSEAECDCRNSNLEKRGSVIRQKVPKTGKTSFKDEIYGEIIVENEEIEDQILIKSDGMPTYNFANVIDDHTMNITHIIRGNEYLSSTPKYNLLYEAFGWELPVYIHVPQIMRDATHKLSKRDGDAYFSDFKAKGYLTSAIINYIALLGWSPKGEESENEIFSLAELTEAFTTDGISKSPAIFDLEKMRAINAEHIRRLSPDEFKRIATPYIGEYPINYDILCNALQPRTEVLTDIVAQVDFLEKPSDYSRDLYNNKKMKTSPESAAGTLPESLNVLSGLGNSDSAEFNKDNLYSAFKKLSEKSDKKPGYYLYPLQVALTGKPAAPGGGLDICVMLGKGESMNRIKKAIERLEEN